MNSKIIKVRYPNLRGKSIKSAAHINQERLLKTLGNLVLHEKKAVGSGVQQRAIIEAQRATLGTTKNNSLTAKELALAPRASERRSKKPKTFAL